MATITRGYSFGSTETVTNSKLHTLVDSATLSAIQQSDLDANLGLVHVATSAPSDTDMLWKNTNITPPVVMYHNGTTWVPVTEYDLLINKTGQTATVGHVCIIDVDNANAFDFTSTKGSPYFAGIVKESIANNASGVVLGRGFNINVLLEISASAGSFLRTSSATGKAENVASGTSNVFGIVQKAGTASAEAYVFGVDFGVDTDADYTWTGTHTFASSIVFNAGASATWNGTMLGDQILKAWCRGNASAGTVADSYNVSSITRNGVGDFTITLTTAMANANYCPIVWGGDTRAGLDVILMASAIGTNTVRVKAITSGGADTDNLDIICMVIFGDRN